MFVFLSLALALVNHLYWIKPEGVSWLNPEQDTAFNLGCLSWTIPEQETIKTLGMHYDFNLRNTLNITSPLFFADAFVSDS